MPKQEKNKKLNPFLWFLIAIIIPGIFAIILAYIIFTMAGVNVGDWLKDKGSTVPVVSSFIKSEEQEGLKQMNEKLELALEDKEEEIELLTMDVEQLQGTIDQLEKDLLKIEKRNEYDAMAENEEKENESVTVKQMAGSFKDMKPEQAALIIERLNNETALAILNAVSNKIRGEILEAMKPEQAAELTELLMEE